MSLFPTSAARWLRGPCPACGDVGGAPLCGKCRTASGIAARGLRRARLSGAPLLFLASYWDRRGGPACRTPAATCLFRFKHGSDRYGGRCLARVFAEEAALHAAAFDGVVAVPPSRQRAGARGHDPAAWLAHRLARRAGVPHCSDLLRRRFDAIPQRGLGGSERRSNVRGAFEVGGAVAVGGRAGPGYSLLLIDDVCTTGSTLLEAASVLLEAGAATVGLAVLACADDALCLQCPTPIDDDGRSATGSRAR